jgi:hypothetical protein
MEHRSPGFKAGLSGYRDQSANGQKDVSLGRGVALIVPCENSANFPKS